MFKKSNSKKVKAVDASWKILIVDDEPGIHTITKISLDDFIFEGKRIKFISAYSAKEAREILAITPDIALVYLDVVMESDDAGLVLVKYIRESLCNKFIRIVLRTGQPGQAPERDVIVNYDINDYKEKTNLDRDSLFTTTLSSLRSYRDIISIDESRSQIESHRAGLEKVISSSASLFRLRSLSLLAEGLLIQLASILGIEQSTLIAQDNSCAVMRKGETFSVLAGFGIFNKESTLNTLPSDVVSVIEKSLVDKQSLYENNVYIGYFPTLCGEVHLIYLEGVNHLNQLDRQLIEVFSHNIVIAFNNLSLNKELFETQSEIISTLGDVVESRSKETANHVKRVAYLSKALAIWQGLSLDEADEIFMASPMHDIGKVAIPDAVLLKPGKLNAQEWEIMKTHVQIGQDIFAGSARPVLKAASIIAGQHHEKYNGTGYPNALSGSDIHIYGRIVAVVDVFDALIHARCYKKAWPLNDVIDFLTEEKGLHFDPQLVDLFLDNIVEVMIIVNKYPD
jgi:response regulator RpfG family c-di-GMP phosphodiesterase